MQPNNNVQNPVPEGPKLETAVKEVVEMENKPVAAEPVKNDISFTDKPKKNNGMLYGMILLAILAIGGIGFGVWAMMDGNAQKEQLNTQIESLKKQIKEMEEKEEEEEQKGETGYWYGKPTTAENVNMISITYGDGNSVIDITDGQIHYYTYDSDGNVPDEYSEVVETDTTEIINYVFDNDLVYMDVLYPDADATWSIEVKGPGTGCAAFGEVAYPDWFKELLTKLNVGENGYTYKIAE